MDNIKNNITTVHNFVTSLSFFHKMFKEGFNELADIVGENTPESISSLGFHKNALGEIVLTRKIMNNGVIFLALALTSSNTTIIDVYGVGEQKPITIAFVPQDTHKKNFYANVVMKCVNGGYMVDTLFARVMSLVYQAVNAMTEARAYNNSIKPNAADRRPEVEQHRA